MSAAQREQRIAALDTRLRIEGFAFECLAVAAPYLNDEDKTGWKPADALNFLVSEIDPEFLQGREISISPQLPNVENPSPEDYEKLDYSILGDEPDVKLQKLKKFWNSMGNLLHQDLKVKDFDIEKAKRQITEANNFCDTLTDKTIFVSSKIFLVELTCTAGHVTKRNAVRLRAEQMIPCMNPDCKSLFRVHGTEPLAWQEQKIQIECDKCKAKNTYLSKGLIGLSYWQKATVLCLEEECDNKIEVQWALRVLPKVIN